MTPNVDKQKQAREEKQRVNQEMLFRRRWLLTSLYVLMIALPLSLLLSTEGLLLTRFPYFDFAAFFQHRGAFPLSFALLGYTVFLVSVWLNVAKYRRDKEKQAQEQALADAGKQVEGVWPPAPKILK